MTKYLVAASFLIAACGNASGDNDASADVGSPSGGNDALAHDGATSASILIFDTSAYSAGDGPLRTGSAGTILFNLDLAEPKREVHDGDPNFQSVLTRTACGYRDPENPFGVRWSGPLPELPGRDVVHMRAVSVVMEVSNPSTVEYTQHIYSCVSYRGDGVWNGPANGTADVPVGQVKATVTIPVDAANVDAVVVGGDSEFNIYSITVDVGGE